jgi:hypothetical protein
VKPHRILSIDTCPHGFKAIILSTPAGIGRRLTSTKCCGTWETGGKKASWNLTPDELRRAGHLFSDGAIEAESDAALAGVREIAPFTIEEARESARAHAMAAARLHSEAETEASGSLDLLAGEHERTAATMRRYVELLEAGGEK